jgi:hypothetical protein
MTVGADSSRRTAERVDAALFQPAVITPGEGMLSLENTARLDNKAPRLVATKAPDERPRGTLEVPSGDSGS